MKKCFQVLEGLEQIMATKKFKNIMNREHKLQFICIKHLNHLIF